jgi:YHS domain-containing protein
MQTTQIVIILSCDAHAETIRRMLDEGKVGTWVVVPGEQARRAGHLQFTPWWPSTSPHVIVGFGDRAVMGQALQRIVRAVHSGTVCPSCLAYTWDAKQTMTPDLVLDPVCGMVADRQRSPHQVHEGVTYHFCSIDCRDRFAKDPERYVSSSELSGNPEAFEEANHGKGPRVRNERG